MSFTFGNVVVVNKKEIGVIVKCWDDDTYEVYVRNYNGICSYKACDIQHYVYGKEVSEDDHGFYN